LRKIRYSAAARFERDSAFKRSSRFWIDSFGIDFGRVDIIANTMDHRLYVG